MTPLQFVVPQIQMLELLPLILLFAAACVGVGIEAFAPRGARSLPQIVLAIFAMLMALVVTIFNWSQGSVGLAAMGSVMLDQPAYFMWCMLLVFGLLALLIFAERKLGRGVTAFTPAASSVPGSVAESEARDANMEHTEIYPLMLLSLFGMMLFLSSNDLITFFVALEVMSLPLYLMSGMARRRRLISQEASLKYFMLGSLASAFFLYGAALLYGYAGSFNLAAIDAAVTRGEGSFVLVVAGMVMMGVGLLFKVGVVPFHNWTPDVYQGAPTPVTAFMAACTKIAAVGGLMRVFYVALGGLIWDWQPLFAVLAVVTMGVGAIVALSQTDIKRMLAYSSIAHAGFIMVAIAGAAQATTGVTNGQVTSVSSVLFYLAAYGFATIGAFGIVTMVRNDGGEVTSLQGWAGLGRKSPGIAAVFALFLLSFAGIPLTAGFIGKWAVFTSAWRGGMPWLVVVAVLMSLVAAYFYLRVIVVMFFTDPDEEVRVERPSWMTMTSIVVGCVVTLLLGIVPGPLLDVATMASEFLR